MTVAAAGAATGEDHEADLLAGVQVLAREAEPLAFEQVRLSTVYDPRGMPAKAGLELLAPGEELPRRIGAEAVCGASLELPGARQAVSLLRWSLDGEPAFGSYESLSRA